jgi:putative endonuclease
VSNILKKTTDMKNGLVYIMSNKNRTTIHIGVTNNIEIRVLEHKLGFVSSFSKRYNLHDLDYYELITGIGNAILREKHG